MQACPRATIVHQPRARVNALTRESVVRGECAFAGARRAVRKVRLPRDERAAGIAGYAGAAEGWSVCR